MQFASAQVDTTSNNQFAPDTAKQSMNMDAVYARPFVNANQVSVSFGGYIEANWQHVGTDGVSEGHQFQFRRLTLFTSASIAPRIKFLSELEFEEGGREVNIEFAAIDFEFDPLFILRGGVMMNPIGAFNQNHDGPKWEFVDRPISATRLLPATWSNAGVGVYGKRFERGWMVGYEFYLSNGFNNSIIQNAENKTFLPAAKSNPERFEESASGDPLITAKVAVRNRTLGEIGFSYMGGVFNKHSEDGFALDVSRRCDVFAIDWNSMVEISGTTILGEWAWVRVDVPETYTQQFGSKQHGGFVDVVQPLFKGALLDWHAATLNAAVRFEFVDWNVGSFRETGGTIGDEVWSVVPAISLRPTARTVVRLNYRYQEETDLFGNPPSKTGGWSFGFSTYF